MNMKSMYRTLSRAPFLLLTLALLLLCLSLPVAAATEENVQDPDYSTFVYNANGTITATFPKNDVLKEAETKIYKPVSPSADIRFLSVLPTGEFLRYENQLTMGGTIYSFAGNCYAGEFLMMGNPEDGLLYCTDAGMAMLSQLNQNRQFSSFALRLPGIGNQHHYGKLPSDIAHEVADLSAGNTETMSLSLPMLRYAPRYEMIGYGADTTWAGMTMGYIYDLEGVAYYLPTDKIPPAALTETGTVNFAMNSTVTLYRLTEDAETGFRFSVYNQYPFFSYSECTYEFDLASIKPSTVMGITGVVGIALPVAPVTVGLVNFLSKKPNGKRRWLALVGMGGAWMLCGVLLLVLLALTLV